MALCQGIPAYWRVIGGLAPLRQFPSFERAYQCKPTYKQSSGPIALLDIQGFTLDLWPSSEQGKAKMLHPYLLAILQQECSCMGFKRSGPRPLPLSALWRLYHLSVHLWYWPFPSLLLDAICKLEKTWWKRLLCVWWCERDRHSLVSSSLIGRRMKLLYGRRRRLRSVYPFYRPEIIPDFSDFPRFESSADYINLQERADFAKLNSYSCSSQRRRHNECRPGKVWWRVIVQAN